MHRAFFLLYEWIRLLEVVDAPEGVPLVPVRRQLRVEVLDHTALTVVILERSLLHLRGFLLKLCIEEGVLALCGERERLGPYLRAFVLCDIPHGLRPTTIYRHRPEAPVSGRIT